ncbi:PLD nuclease N-terminal domain-containing protein [Kineosporia sp. NBRC 101731]|uniref:PLD nuclease N-terminal domain-containing protein n=1 Tax=Kineosporia sp. NBRC 101731 TaxID=3032199 RepID=UPI0024A50246|nr:PLD nuclease N-terminal domain-containing protein [Kineosporia sp. NBRC 101731]GLY32697.1 membrane protein [Kineosporia sp. NBRC 101731]
MVRFLPVLIELGLLIFCLIDCIQTDSTLVRNLPKPLWILLIVFLPLIGSIAWLVAGRTWPSQAGNPVPWRSTATAGFPEYERPGADRHDAAAIDEQLRRDTERVDREHEEALRKWEESLKERERKLGEGV